MRSVRMLAHLVFASQPDLFIVGSLSDAGESLSSQITCLQRPGPRLAPLPLY